MSACPPLTWTVGFWFSCAVITACEKPASSEHTPVSRRAPAAPATLQKSAPPAPQNPVTAITGPQLLTFIARSEQQGVMVNIWATWCGPCREELPMLAQVAKRYQKRRLLILPVSVDEEKDEQKIPAMLKEYGFEPPYLRVSGPIGAFKETMYVGWPGNIPVSFLFNGKGQARHFWDAEIYESELVPKLDAFLNGELTEERSRFPSAPGKTFDK